MAWDRRKKQKDCGDNLKGEKSQKVMRGRQRRAESSREEMRRAEMR